MRHLVLRQIFDVKLRSRQQAYGIQQRLSRFFWDSVAPALEQLFDRLAPGDAILRIDKLEIDLGNIPVEGLTDPEILRRIVAAVEEQLLKITRSTNSDFERLHTPNNRFEQWLYFLEHGILPWYAEKSEWSAKRSNVIETLASSASAAAQLRQLVARKEQALDRLILQHDAPFLQTIATLFSGLSQRGLADFVAELDALLNHIGGFRPQAGGAPLSPRQTVTWFWKWVLHALMVRQQKFQGEALIAMFLQTAPDPDTRSRIVRKFKQKSGAQKYPVIGRMLAKELTGESPVSGQSFAEMLPENNPQLVVNEPLVQAPGSRKSNEAIALPESGNSVIRPESDDKSAGIQAPVAELSQEVRNPREKVIPISPENSAPQKPLPEQEISDRDTGKPAGSIEQNALQEKTQREAEPTSDQQDTNPQLPEDSKAELIQNLKTGADAIAGDRAEKPVPAVVKATGNEPEPFNPEASANSSGETSSTVQETPEDQIPLKKEVPTPQTAEKSAHSALKEVEMPLAPEQKSDISTPADNLLQPEVESSAPEPDPVIQTISKPSEPNAQTIVDKPAAIENERRDHVANSEMPIPGDSRLQTQTLVLESGLTTTTPPVAIAPPGTEEALSWDYDDMPDNSKSWQLDHAGVVLLNAYLPTFFKTLELTEGKKFRNKECQNKAACLLHYLATGEQTPPEYELLLAKILCGIPMGAPLDAGAPISAEETEEAEALLEAVIGHWTALGKVSIAGLREGFLSRAGKLSHQENGWKLQMERNTIDILLDRAPFSVGLIKLPWMKEILWVEW